MSTPPSRLFTRDVAVRRFMAERFPMIARYLGPAPSTDYIWDKLLAADALRYEAIQVDNFAPGELEGLSQPNPVEHAA